MVSVLGFNSLILPVMIPRFFTVACFLFSLITHAQINPADSSVQVIAYWANKEKQSYNFTNEKFNVINNDSLITESVKYKVNITVLDSSDTGYILEWKYGSYESSSKAEQSAAKLYNGLALKFATDEMGSFKEWLNLEEIKKHKDNALESMKNEASDVLLKTYITTLKIKYSTEEGLIDFISKDIDNFYTFNGLSFKSDEPIEENLPEELDSGKSINTLVTIRLSDIDVEDGSYILKFWQEYDSEDVQQYMADFFSEFLGDMIKRKDIKAFKNMGLEDYYGVHMHETGWPLYVRYQRTVITDDMQRLEVKTIEIE